MRALLTVTWLGLATFASCVLPELEKVDGFGGSGTSAGGSIGQAGDASGGDNDAMAGHMNGSSGSPGGVGPVSDGGAGGQSATGVGGGGGEGPELGAAGADNSFFTASELNVIATLGPLPAVPADPTNQYADVAGAAALGQKLFFDKGFSGALALMSDLGNVGETGKVACASCHGSSAFADDRSTPSNISLGTNRMTRNAPALVDSAYYSWTNWGGRFSAQWELPLAVLENPTVLNGNRLALAHRIFDFYKSDYEAVFGTLDTHIGTDTVRFPAAGKPKASSGNPDGAWESMSNADHDAINLIFVNYGKALQAYTRKLVSGPSAFDQLVAGNEAALSTAAKRGLRLFIGKAGCVQCHQGPFFSDQGFHNLGVPQTGENVPASDEGRFKDVPPLLASLFNSAGEYSDDQTTGRLTALTNPMPEGAKGQFRTPTLRGVSATAPYMHAGQFATLEAVIDFYAAGGGTPTSGVKDAKLQGFGISAGERSDLVEFLEALEGGPVPSNLTIDTSKP